MKIETFSSLYIWVINNAIQQNFDYILNSLASNTASLLKNEQLCGNLIWPISESLCVPFI